MKKSLLFGKMALLGLMLLGAQNSWADPTKNIKVNVTATTTGAGSVYVEPFQSNDRAENCYEHTGAATAATPAANDSFKAVIQKSDWGGENDYSFHFWMHAETTNDNPQMRLYGFYVSKDAEVANVPVHADLSDYTYCHATGDNDTGRNEQTLRLEEGVWKGEIALDGYATEYEADNRDEVYADAEKAFEDLYVYAVWGPRVRAMYAEGSEELGTLAQEINENGEFVLTATPNTGYNLEGWYDAEGTQVSTLTNWVLPAETEAVDYYARFVEGTVNLSYYIGPNVFGSYVDAQDGSYNGTAFGTFSLSPENAVVGDEVTLTATPAPGYAFSHWTNKVDDATTVLSTEATWTTTAEYATYYPVFKLAPVHIGDAKWATFSASSKVCYVDSESKNTLKVYAVVEKDAEGELAFKQMKYTTPNVGLVCNADEAGDYELTYNGLVVGNYSYKDFSAGVEDEAFDTNTNLLQGTANGAFTVPAEDDGYYYYVLADKNRGVGFYLAAAGLVIPQNKAYLKIAKSAAAKTFYGFDETATNLISVNADVETGNVEMYNVAGQKVGDSYRGIVIVNGKKYFNK